MPLRYVVFQKSVQISRICVIGVLMAAGFASIPYKNLGVPYIFISGFFIVFQMPIHPNLAFKNNANKSAT